MTDFKQFGLPSELIQSLDGMRITTPTSIQVLAIPPALEGHDLLASAQTGTGKTIAFSAPLVARLISTPGSTALILVPTRELATQVKSAINQLLGTIPACNTALLIGGEPMQKQLAQLRLLPRIIIGTPGRVTDHLVRGTLKLDKTQFFVLDEADRMLDMGFSMQLDKIAKFLPEVRQTMMFSSTLPSNIIKLSKKYLRDPKRVAVGATTQPATKIKQEVIYAPAEERFSHLVKEVEKRDGSIIVFVKTKRGARVLADKLNRFLAGKFSEVASRRDNQLYVDAIHGDLPQRKRERVLESFRNRKYRIIVATDVAARGLDIPHIKHVINYDIPQCLEDYIHRIGRTARAQAEGSALCMVLPEEKRKWLAMCRMMESGQSLISNDSDILEESGRSRVGVRNNKRKSQQFSFKRQNKKPFMSKNTARYVF